MRCSATSQRWSPPPGPCTSRIAAAARRAGGGGGGAALPGRTGRPGGEGRRGDAEEGAPAAGAVHVEDRGRGPPVQVSPSALRRLAVDGLAHDGVAEDVAACRRLVE